MLNLFKIFRVLVLILLILYVMGFYFPLAHWLG